MRLLSRNKRVFMYASITGATRNVDTNGNRTGNDTPTYSTPVSAYGHVTEDMDVGRVDSYGIESRFDNAVSKSGFSRTILLEGTDWNITDKTVIWLDDLDVTHPYDHVVKRVSKNQNQTTIAVASVR